MSSPSSSSSTAMSESLTLIPGLPHEISTTILSLLPPSHRSRVKSVSRAFNLFLSNPNFSHSHPILCIFPTDPSLSPPPYLFDLSSLAWKPLPPVPCSTHLYGLSNFKAVAVGKVVFVIGGSQFDARAYPLGRPIAAGGIVKIDLGMEGKGWEKLPDMSVPRGSFACASVERSRPESKIGRTTGEKRISGSSSNRLGESGMILVAGGGSRHTMYPCEGNRSRVVEAFDVSTGEWTEIEPLPRCRAGCVGWIMNGEEEEEFWVMGGYGGYRAVSGVFPADVYYKDGSVFGLRSRTWREIENMWEDGERRKLGLVAVVYEDNGETSGVFMLDKSDIFRYDFTLNRWMKEATLPRRIIHGDETCSFVAINGELYVLKSRKTLVELNHLNPRKAAGLKKKATLEIQVYHPKRGKWRFITTTTTPFDRPLNFNIAVLCSVCI